MSLLIPSLMKESSGHGSPCGVPIVLWFELAPSTPSLAADCSLSRDHLSRPRHSTKPRLVNRRRLQASLPAVGPTTAPTNPCSLSHATMSPSWSSDEQSKHQKWSHCDHCRCVRLTIFPPHVNPKIPSRRSERSTTLLAETRLPDLGAQSSTAP